MLDATQWWKEWDGARRPWLVLDNGPSLARREEFDLTPYATVALIGIAGETHADVAFFSDWKTVSDLAGKVASTVKFLLLPNASSAKASSDIIEGTPALQEMETEGRLISYDPALAPGVGDAGKVISLLGALGARHVRTLGVDNGPQPTPEVVQKSDSIAAAIQKYNLFSGPLTCEVPARIFIGSDPSQELGAKMLEYTVRKHSTITTTFDTMQNVEVPMPKDPNNQPRTQFSFNRFVIPALAGYHGRGLYLDADMQVFSDLRELWEMPFGDATAMYAPPSNPSRPKQTSVMLLDCDRLSWDIKNIVRDLDEGRYDYEGLLRDMKLEPEGAVQDRVPTDWNSLEEYTPGKTRLLHYTDMKTQPWVSRRNPLGDLWAGALRDAIADCFVSPGEVKRAVRDGYIRPSLLRQISLNPAKWPLFLRTAGRILDVRYKPHRALRKRLSRAKIGIS